MKIQITILCLLYCIAIPFAYGQENNTVYINKLNSCIKSKAVLDDYMPQFFQPTNNLLRMTGEKASYCGRKIILKGRVLDENCAPVSDAKVYLWQIGCDGRYPYTPFKNGLKTKKWFNQNPPGSFQGNGTATTNNKGEFYFITIFPTAGNRQKPHVNFKVEHYKLGALQTRIYLSNIDLLDNPIDLESDFVNLKNDPVYGFDIVMPGDSGRSY